MLQSAFFDVKREAAKKTAFRDDHARYSGPQPETCSARIIQVCADAVRTIVNRGIMPEEMFSVPL